MNRRTLLTCGSSVAVTAATGCLDAGTDATDPDGSTPTYESCSLAIVSYERLPTDVKHEVEIAFAEGEYRHDDRVLWEQIDDGIEAVYDVPDRASDEYFEPIVEEYDGGHRLRFTEATVTNPFAVLVSNTTTESVSGSITIERETDPVLTEEAFEIAEEADERIEIGDVELGEYDVHLSYDDGTEVSETIPNSYYDEPLGPPELIIEADDVRAVRPPDDGGRREPCTWD